MRWELMGIIGKRGTSTAMTYAPTLVLQLSTFNLF